VMARQTASKVRQIGFIDIGTPEVGASCHPKWYSQPNSCLVFSPHLMRAFRRTTYCREQGSASGTGFLAMAPLHLKRRAGFG
jgi:hypothetical protein